MAKKPLDERFWEKVGFLSESDCWPWKGKIRDGYGRFMINRKYRPAAAVAWEIFNAKPFPKGLLACHKCDNPICVNPMHIFPGTYKENIQDCIRKGRRADQKGFNNGNCKITQKELDLIKDLRLLNYSGRAIANAVGLCKSQIYNILNGIENDKKESSSIA